MTLPLPLSDLENFDVQKLVEDLESQQENNHAVQVSSMSNEEIDKHGQNVMAENLSVKKAIVSILKTVLTIKEEQKALINNQVALVNLVRNYAPEKQQPIDLKRNKEELLRQISNALIESLPGKEGAVLDPKSLKLYLPEDLIEPWEQQKNNSLWRALLPWLDSEVGELIRRGEQVRVEGKVAAASEYGPARTLRKINAPAVAKGSQQPSVKHYPRGTVVAEVESLADKAEKFISSQKNVFTLKDIKNNLTPKERAFLNSTRNREQSFRELLIERKAINQIERGVYRKGSKYAL